MLNLPLNNNNHNLLRFVEQPNSHTYVSFGCRADVLSVAFSFRRLVVHLLERTFLLFLHTAIRVFAHLPPLSAFP